MTFEEHVENHRRPDGGFDLDAAEEDRRYELETDPEQIVKQAAKVARQERIAWQSRETANLRKQFDQPALSADLEMDIKVPVGNSVAYRYGDMDQVRIRLRKDMRTKTHINENRAFDVEMTHWLHTEPLLNKDETIEDAWNRGGLE